MTYFDSGKSYRVFKDRNIKNFLKISLKIVR